MKAGGGRIRLSTQSVPTAGVQGSARPTDGADTLWREPVRGGVGNVNFLSGVMFATGTVRSRHFTRVVDPLRHDARDEDLAAEPNKLKVG